MAFVFAYRTDTGQQVRVPESHLRIFPKALSLTPPATEPAPSSPAPTPVEEPARARRTGEPKPSRTGGTNPTEE